MLKSNLFILWLGLFVGFSHSVTKIKRQCHTIENTQTSLQFLKVPKQAPFLAKVAAQKKPGAGDFPALNLVHLTNHFEIHYTTSGEHSINLANTTGSPTNDYLELVANLLEEAWSYYLIQNKWNPPPLAGETRYQVYLSNLDQSYYGYVQPWNVIGNNPATTDIEVNSHSSYIALRNKYGPIYGGEERALKVTIIHEFLHSIQFGYDAWEDPWLVEGVATSMESWVYPEIEDNLQYLWTWQENTDSPLTFYSGTETGPSEWDGREYSNWILFQYLHEKYNGAEFSYELTKNSLLFNSSVKSYGLEVMDLTLQKFGTSFIQTFIDYHIAYEVASSDSAKAPYIYKNISFYQKDRNLDFSTESNFDIDKLPFSFHSTQGNDRLSANSADVFHLYLGQESTLEFQLTDKESPSFAVVVDNQFDKVEVMSQDLKSNSKISIGKDWIEKELTLFLFYFGEKDKNQSYSIVANTYDPNVSNKTLNWKHSFVALPVNSLLKVFDITGTLMTVWNSGETFQELSLPTGSYSIKGQINGETQVFHRNVF